MKKEELLCFNCDCELDEFDDIYEFDSKPICYDCLFDYLDDNEKDYIFEDFIEWNYNKLNYDDLIGDKND